MNNDRGGIKNESEGMRERMNDGEDLLKKQRIRNKAKRSAMSEKAVEFMGCDIVDHRP